MMKQMVFEWWIFVQNVIVMNPWTWISQKTGEFFDGFYDHGLYRAPFCTTTIWENMFFLYVPSINKQANPRGRVESVQKLVVFAWNFPGFV